MKTEEYEKTIELTSGKIPTESTTEQLQKSPSRSKPVETQTQALEDKPRTKRKRKKKEQQFVAGSGEWMSDDEWMYIASHSKLPSRSRTVHGFRSGITYKIPPNGIWVWRPDAELILDMQNLASCTPDKMILRPFGIASPCHKIRKNKPSGPPETVHTASEMTEEG